MSDLIKNINDYIETSDVGYLSIDLLEFINDEYNREKDKKSDEEDRRMEEVDFHNLTTVHNIAKLWELLHSETIVKRGRKSKNSPVNAEVLKSIKSSVEGIVTGFEAPPNPDFIIGGYTIPDEIKFEGKRKGRKPSWLKTYSFPVSYRAALNDTIAEEFAPKNEVISTNNADNDNIVNTVENTSKTVLDNDQFDNDCYHVVLYKKPDPPKRKSKSKSKSNVNVNSNSNSNLPANIITDSPKTSSLSSCSSNNSTTSNSDSNPFNNNVRTPFILPAEFVQPAPFIPTVTLDTSKFSKPTLHIRGERQLVDRMDVLRAGLRHVSSNKLSSKLNYNVNHNCVVGLASSKSTLTLSESAPVSTLKSESSPAPRSIITNISRKNVPCIVERVIPEPTPKIQSLSLTTTLPFITPRLESILASGPTFKSVVKPGRPLGSPNKTPEQKEQEMLNKKPKGRQLGSGNKKATKKKDEDVIIYDREIPLRINPNKFEVHMIQYTLENPYISYAEWNRYSERLMEKVRELNKETSRQRLNVWEENTMRKINRIKGRMSLGSGKGKEKVLYEPDSEIDKETLEYKYELLETRKHDPFFVNLLKRSFELRSSGVSGSTGTGRSSRKSRFDDIGNSDACSVVSDYGIYVDSYDNNSVLDVDCSSEKDMFVSDLIDLSDKPVNNELSVGELYMNELLDRNNDNGDNEDVISKLLNELHSGYANNSKKEDVDVKSNDVMLLCMNIYQCVYSMYNMCKQ